MTGNIDLRQLYIDLISDYDPFADMAEHENLDESEMLYNLIEIRDNNGIDECDNEDEQLIYERFLDVISIFKAAGVNPYFN